MFDKMVERNSMVDKGNEHSKIGSNHSERKAASFDDDSSIANNEDGNPRHKSEDKSGSQKKNFTLLYLGIEHYNKIWKPDFFFPDAIEMRRPILDGEESLQVKLDRMGSITMSMRLITVFRYDQMHPYLSPRT